MTRISETALLNSVKSLNETINLIEDTHMGSQAELQRLIGQSSNRIEPSYMQPNTPNARIGSQPKARIGSQAELQRLIDQSSNRIEPSYMQPNTPNARIGSQPKARIGSQAELQRLIDQSSNRIEPSYMQPDTPNAQPSPEQPQQAEPPPEQPQQAAPPPESLDDVAKQRAFERPFITPNSKKETPFKPSPEDAFYDPYYSPEQFKGDFTNNPKEADQATEFQRKWNGEPAYPRQFFQTPNGPRSTVIKPTDPVAEGLEFNETPQHPAGIPKTASPKFDPAIQKRQYELRPKYPNIPTNGILDPLTKQIIDQERHGADHSDPVKESITFKQEDSLARIIQLARG